MNKCMYNHYEYVFARKDKKGRPEYVLKAKSGLSLYHYMRELREVDIKLWAEEMCKYELQDLMSDFEWIGEHPYRKERVMQFRQKIGELRRIGGLSHRQVKKYYQIN